MSSGLTNPLRNSLATRATYIAGLQESGHSAADIDSVLSRWVLTKHAYVAPTDEEAESDARSAQEWYRESYIRSITAAGIPGLSESVYREA